MMTGKIDFSYRPETYFSESPNREQLLSKIKGKVRREEARARLETFGFSALNDFIARESLDEEERKAWGAIHPANMGGEYLPDPEEDEVEIARVSLRSVTADQITIRARRDGRRIRYRVEDEYETKYQLPFAYSHKPLTLRKLVRLINKVDDGYHEGGLVIGFWELQLDFEDREGAEKFVSIDSAYYPELKRYYAEYADRWFQRRLPSEDSGDSRYHELKRYYNANRTHTSEQQLEKRIRVFYGYSDRKWEAFKSKLHPDWNLKHLYNLQHDDFDLLDNWPGLSPDQLEGIIQTT